MKAETNLPATRSNCSADRSRGRRATCGNPTPLTRGRRRDPRATAGYYEVESVPIGKSLVRPARPTRSIEGSGELVLSAIALPSGGGADRRQKMFHWQTFRRTSSPKRWRSWETGRFEHIRVWQEILCVTSPFAPSPCLHGKQTW
jgi:hypothetical protein